MQNCNGRTFLFLKTLDLYLLREYLKILLCGLAIFCILIICYNLANYQANFSSKESTSQDLYLFILLRLPPDIIFILPLTFFLTSLYLLGKMGLTNETIAARATGITISRLGLPIYISTLIISLLATWLNSEIIPKCNFTSEVLITSQIYHDYDGYGAINLVYKSQDSKRIWFIRHFKDYNVQYGITLKKYDDNNKLETELSAERSLFLDDQGWSFYNATLLEYEQLNLPTNLMTSYDGLVLTPTSKTFFPLLDKKNPKYKLLGEIDETASDLQSFVRNPARLTLTEILKALKNPETDIEKIKTSLKVELLRRLSLPIVCLLFVLIAVPIGGITLTRKDVILSTIKLTVVICFYLFSFYASGILATGGFIPPIVANSIPMIGLAIYAFYVNKKSL